MKAIIFLINAGFSIVLSVFLIRAILQIVRGNFRNPITQAITRFTNPLIMPLRKVLPPLGKIDTATLVSCILIAAAMNLVLVFLGAVPIIFFVQQPYGFVLAIFLRLFLALLQLYWGLIIFTIILSWAQPHQHSPLSAFLRELSDPILRPARRIIPPLGDLDVSPIPVLLILSALQYQFSALI